MPAPPTPRMTADALLAALVQAQEQRQPCVLATLAAVQRPTELAAGDKALIFADGRVLGSLGTLHATLAAEAMPLMHHRQPVLQTFANGTLTVLFEPQLPREALVIIGAGHCGQALCHLARQCGWHVTVVDDRAELLATCDAHTTHCGPATDYIATHPWQPEEALVLVSRSYPLDRAALAAALAHPGHGYLGMIGSRKKVHAVFADLRTAGHTDESLAHVHAPIGLDIAADTPMEIAVSVLAELMRVLRHRTGQSLKL